MARMAKVYHKRTDMERIVTEKSYNLGQSFYKFLGWVDEDGNAIGGPNASQPQGVKSAEPVARVSPEERAAEMAELEEMNRKALEKRDAQLDPKEEIVVEKKKRGRPAKVNA